MKKLVLIILVAGAFVSNVYAQWSTSGSNVFYNGGNVGIGTNGPNKKLEINNSLRLNNGGTTQKGVLDFGLSDVVFENNLSGTHGGEFLIKNWNGTGYNNAIYIAPSGFVGFGTTSPAQKLSLLDGNIMLKTSSNSNEQSILFQNSGSSYVWRVGRTGTSTADLAFAGGSSSDPANLATRVTFKNSGEVGIGTTAPGKKLEVNNSLRLNNGGSTQKGTLDFGLSDVVFENNPNGNNAGEFLIKNYNGTGYNTSLFIKGDGNIGIGTVTPDFKLTVNGKIKAEEVQVVVDVPADYVFEADYYLRPLQEVETYVKAHKHLPGIPSADELKEQGWQIGEMNNLLLEKVEELTLYMIELKKENERMMEEMKQLKAQIDRE